MISSLSKTPKTILIIGYGDIGQRVAQRWRRQGAAVFALGRQPKQKRNPIEAVTLLAGNLDQRQDLKQIQLPTDDAIIYYFAPPPATGETDPRIDNFLDSIKKTPASIVYISTSGVYGDCHGAWVTEEQAPQPQALRSKRRLAAEKMLTEWGSKHHVTTIILRVAGIYGPGRLPLERLRRGDPILRSDQASFSNRIHADDLANICIAAAAIQSGLEIFNVCDGQPSSMSEYFLSVAEVFGIPAPEEIDWQQAQQQFSTEMLSYLRESRRLNIDKLKQHLNITFQYPDLRAGLKAIKEQT